MANYLILLTRQDTKQACSNSVLCTALAVMALAIIRF